MSLALVALALSACATTPPSNPEPPPVGFAASEAVYFDNLPELVATSDLAIVGTVEAVDAGMTEAGGSPEEIRHTNVTIRIDETLWGMSTDDTVVVETLELAYARPYREWRVPGTAVIAFLIQSTEGRPIFITTNHSQSVYLVDSAGDVQPAVPDTLADQVAAASLADTRRTVADAVVRILRGEIAPKERER